MTRQIPKHILLAFLFGALVLVSCATATPTETPTAEPDIVLSDCMLAMPGTVLRITAQCGTLDVFENRESNSGRQISLNIAVLPAISRSPQPDPLFFLAGGPGQAATETYPLLARTFRDINRDRDIVLVDQRGTGSSNPLRCEFPANTPEDADLKPLLENCLDEIEAFAAPEHYTTEIAMQDLDQVREKLGYDQINIYGVSYGTRAAFAYMRMFPERLRAVVLDGLAPPQLALGLAVAADAQRSIDLIFARCAANPACDEAFPNLEGTFNALISALEAEPVTVSLPHPNTGESTEFTLDADGVAIAVRLMSYSPESVAMLPLLIHTAQVDGNFTPLAAQFLMTSSDLDTSINNAMGYSVLCAEDEPFFTNVDSANANTYLGNLQTDSLKDVCDVWPHEPVPAAMKTPVSVDAPVLLLSGEFDPVTPPAYGDLAAETLPNSLHLVAPESGHNVVTRGCLPNLVEQFVENASFAELDTACVAEIEPFPFFINFSGPVP